MRLRIAVTTRARHLPWEAVLAPSRGIAYDLLAQADPALASRMHASGRDGTGMAPFGCSRPVFPAAPRCSGRYAVGGDGYVELGSPLPGVVAAWADALDDRDMLDWGGTTLWITAVHRLEPPSFARGQARMRTGTPTVVKSEPQEPPGGGRPRSRMLLPAEPGYPEALWHNLNRKAEFLGYPRDVDLVAVTWAGPKRSFTDGHGSKTGAEVEVELAGAPAFLRALWSWGLGESTTVGFGWIEAAR